MVHKEEMNIFKIWNKVDIEWEDSKQTQGQSNESVSIKTNPQLAWTSKMPAYPSITKAMQ